MMRGMFAAISGLKQHQVMLDVTANDIANVNTIGYKCSRVTFQDSLTQMQRGASGPTTNNGGSNAAQVGLGVGLGSVDNLMTGGAMQTTGNPLDVAIQGDGFFQLAERRADRRQPRPTPTAYTRAGNFSINSEGYLTSQTGQYVTGYAMPGGTTDVAIQIPTGRLGHRHRPVRRRLLRRPDDRAPASPRTASRWPRSRTRPASSARAATRGSRRPTRARRPSTRRASAAPGTTTAGAVEMSNVDLATTFTNMITAQRGFQANSRVISTADSMLEELVNLKH